VKERIAADAMAADAMAAGRPDAVRSALGEPAVNGLRFHAGQDGSLPGAQQFGVLQTNGAAHHHLLYDALSLECYDLDFSFCYHFKQCYNSASLISADSTGWPRAESGKESEKTRKNSEKMAAGGGEWQRKPKRFTRSEISS